MYITVLFVVLCSNVNAQFQLTPQMQREAEAEGRNIINRIKQRAIPPASWLPNAWKITINGYEGDNNILFSSQPDCRNAIRTFTDDMVNATIRMVSKYMNASLSQSEMAQVRNAVKDGITTMYNCGCKQVSNPNYKPEKPIADYNNTYGSKNQDNQDNKQTTENGTSQIQGNIFDVPGAREKPQKPSENQPSQNAPPKINMNNLDAYFDENKYTGVAVITIVGNHVNTQSEDKLTSMSNGGTHGNIFLREQETENLYEQLNRNNKIEWKSDRIQTELQRRDDAVRYENTTPEYQKTIDRYSQNENPSFSEDVQALGAYSVKVMDKGLEALDKSGEFMKNVVAGQAKIEIKAGIIAALDVLTEGKVGKAEVNAMEGYGNALKATNKIFSAGGKIVDAIGNPDKSEVISQKIEQNQKQYLETADNYAQTKGIATPNQVINAPVDMINGVGDKENKRLIRKMPNGDIKQGVGLLNGVRSNYDGSFLNFEYGIKESKK